MAAIVEVFRQNFRQETTILRRTLASHRTITVDTEFPGCLRCSPRFAPNHDRYADMKYNVENTKLIQVGLTLSDDYGNIGGVWQFNFSDFNPDIDPNSPESIALLRNNGIDFEKNASEGVEISEFAGWLVEIIVAFFGKLTWVMFHGTYDIAYLLTILAPGVALPCTMHEFLGTVRSCFGVRVYDVKVIAEGCSFLPRHAGLEKVAGLLKVERAAGQPHQAGSDSLLTAAVFRKLKVDLRVNVGVFMGIVFGISGCLVPRFRASQPRPYGHDVRCVGPSDVIYVAESHYYTMF